MAAKKIQKSKVKIQIKTIEQPVVKNDKINFWGVFKSFVLVGGDLV